MIAVLSRAFGIRRLDLIEDMVQAAMLQAMNSWKQKGVPENPAGWIHRVARNRILDHLRREKTHQRALAFAGQSLDESESLVEQWLEHDQIPDSLLRMMFVCCHPSLNRRSQIALTLKILCGFSVDEIARGLLLKTETVRKAIQRAKQQLAKQKLKVEVPDESELQDRLQTVHEVLYLMYNEGYSTSQGLDPIRVDLCEEAARLCHLLCEHSVSNSTTYAILALMLFHAARLPARMDEDGAVVLLDDQDRSKWDQGLIQIARQWLARSGRGELSQYHLQAAIAMQHCQAKSVESTNWPVIVQLYEKLGRMNNSPIYVLNMAIARAQSGDIKTAFKDLANISEHPDMADYYLLDCARARFHEMQGENNSAIDCYLVALHRENLAPHERALLKKKIALLAK